MRKQGSVKEVPLTRGKVALVDAEDYEYINQWKWRTRVDGNSLYAMRQVKSMGKTQTVLMHRVLNKTPKGCHTDHINCNGLDNRKENLRTVTQKQNQQNRASRYGASRYKGVNPKNSRWRARIRVDKKLIHLGYFDSEIDAAKCYDVYATKHFGKYANTNF